MIKKIQIFYQNPIILINYVNRQFLYYWLTELNNVTHKTGIYKIFIHFSSIQKKKNLKYILVFFKSFLRVSFQFAKDIVFLF
jgi:hypothetical protein